MNQYSIKSTNNLETCDGRLIEWCKLILPGYDHSVDEGNRGETEQNYYFEKGLSQFKWPDGKHNIFPSHAVHLKPYPMKWELILAMDKILREGQVLSRQILQRAFREYAKFYHFAGYAKRIASEIGISIRWGGDWDSDNDFNDQRFHDLLHWELV